MSSTVISTFKDNPEETEKKPERTLYHRWGKRATKRLITVCKAYPDYNMEALCEVFQHPTTLSHAKIKSKITQLRSKGKIPKRYELTTKTEGKDPKALEKTRNVFKDLAEKEPRLCPKHGKPLKQVDAWNLIYSPYFQCEDCQKGVNECQ